MLIRRATDKEKQFYESDEEFEWFFNKMQEKLK